MILLWGIIGGLFMAQSLNKKVDLTINGTFHTAVATYGKIMVGDAAFEFYNDKNVEDYVQIPWSEVDYIAAAVVRKGKWIPRFAIHTKKDGQFSFSSRDNKALLRAVNEYIPSDKLLRALSFGDVMKRRLKSIGQKFKK